MPKQLRRSGLIEDEVLAHLRRHGVDSLSDVRYVLYESKGELTIVPERGLQVPDPDLVQDRPPRDSHTAAPPSREGLLAHRPRDLSGLQGRTVRDNQPSGKANEGSRTWSWS